MNVKYLKFDVMFRIIIKNLYLILNWEKVKQKLRIFNFLLLIFRQLLVNTVIRNVLIRLQNFYLYIIYNKIIEKADKSYGHLMLIHRYL